MGELLIGQDPRAIGRIDAMLYSFTRTVPGGLNQNAAGAILNACLDIKGKALGVPVYELFGGAVRDRIPVYWSRCGVIRARCAEYFDGKVIDQPAVHTVDDLKARRARGARPRLQGDQNATSWCSTRTAAASTRRAPRAARAIPNSTCRRRCSTRCIAQLTALREGAGPKLRIAVDLNFNYKAEGFRRIAKKVEPFDLMWLEMDMYEPEALAAIRQSTTTPIASLETILGRRALKPYLEAHCADVAIIDPQYNGVPEACAWPRCATPTRSTWRRTISPARSAAIICAHFAAVIPNLRISEYDVDEVPWKPKLLTHPPVIENGEFVLPTGPGWGTDVNEDELRAHAPMNGHP